MTAPRDCRETQAKPPLAKQRRAASLKSHRTRKRMAAAREREKQRREDEFVAEHGPHAYLWPSSYRPSED